MEFSDLDLIFFFLSLCRLQKVIQDENTYKLSQNQIKTYKKSEKINIKDPDNINNKSKH